MIKFGEYVLDSSRVDVAQHHREMAAALDDNKGKLTGAKNHNAYLPIPRDTKKELSVYLNEVIDGRFDWNFEYYHSGEPVGLHTDYDTIPWSDNVNCRVVVGVLIPLGWNCKQPYTVFYDRLADEPRKLVYRNGEMRYKDTMDPIIYRNEWKFDDEVLSYNPLDTVYAKEYADLKVHSAYRWELNTMCIFDTRRWHSSSWFLSTNSLPDVSTEYKRSIVGFGSIDV